MKSFLLLSLLFAVGDELSAASNTDYYRDTNIRALVKKAEFWKAKLLRTAGYMKLKNDSGYVAWVVSDAVDTNQARLKVLADVREQVRRIFPRKTVLFQENPRKKPIFSLEVYVDGRRYTLTEVARWKKGGQRKSAFLFSQ